MFLPAMQFIVKIYPNIKFHIGAIVCAVIGNCTTAQPQVLKETYDLFFPSDTSVYMSVMELARNKDSKTYWSILCIATDYFKFVKKSKDFVPRHITSISCILCRYVEICTSIQNFTVHYLSAYMRHICRFYIVFMLLCIVKNMTLVNCHILHSYITTHILSSGNGVAPTSKIFKVTTLVPLA